MDEDYVQSNYFLSTMDIGSYNVLTLTRFEPISTTCTSLPSGSWFHVIHFCSSFDFLTIFLKGMGRELSIVECRFGDITIKFGNVHLESLDKEQDSQAIRVRQLDQIFPLLGDAVPSFLCGDFNFDGNARNSKEESRIPHQWQDMAADKTQNTLGVNYPSKKHPPGRFDRMLLRQPQGEAQVLSRNSWNVFGDQPLADNGERSPQPEASFFYRRGPYISDHLGLCARFVRFIGRK